MRLLTIILAIATAFAAGSVATAATGWKVFATANDSGDFATFANANAKVLLPKKLAIRTSGPVTSASWTLTCDGETKGRSSVGLLVVAVNTAKSCQVYGSAFGDAGRLRIQLLRG